MMNKDDQSCGNCLFFNENPYRRCLRFPPQRYDEFMAHGFTFPTVAYYEWCGEWKSKEGNGDEEN